MAPAAAAGGRTRWQRERSQRQRQQTERPALQILRHASAFVLRPSAAGGAAPAAGPPAVCGKCGVGLAAGAKYGEELAARPIM
eukprot:gene44986-17006_t